MRGTARLFVNVSFAGRLLGRYSPARFCRTAPGGKAAAKGPVQVEAAAAAHAVQRFAHKVKAGTALELEIRFQLGEGKATAGDLRLLPAAGVRPSNRQCLAVWASFCHWAAESRCTSASGKADGLPQGTAQLGVQQAQPEVCRRIARQQGYAGGEQRGKCVLGNVREEVQLHGRVFTAGVRWRVRSMMQMPDRP